jgi:hypothetical protein
MDSNEARRQPAPWFWRYDLGELLRATATLEELRSAVGAVNPRPPGWHNYLIQLVKRLVARSLAWYTRPLREFNTSVSRSLEEIACALDHLSLNMLALDQLSLNMVALEGRLAQSEKGSASLRKSTEEQLDLLREQLKAVGGVPKTVNPEGPGRMKLEWRERSPANFQLYTDTDLGGDRTAYVIGLFGSGRHYINETMLRNIGRRAKYFRDAIRLHPGPTPMIYSGHATMKHISRAQASPEVMSRVLEAVRWGFADVIFVYRHPLDSLLTNWMWWRTYIRDNIWISGISQVYKNTDDLCGILEQNFSEFRAFAEGNPDFFAAMPGTPFLSFAEFVEETELHLQAATLALRLEDCTINPQKEFFRIAEAMSVDLDWSRLSVAPPITKSLGYLAVKEKVPLFRNFIAELSPEIKSRIEKMGYAVTA